MKEVTQVIDTFEYRKKLFRDAQSWKKPDRIPFSANVFTWMWLDAGYSVPVATRNYEIIEECMVRFVQKYRCDSLNVNSSGFRNAFLINDSLGEGSGYTDKQDVSLNVSLSDYLKVSEFPEAKENLNKVLWEKVLFRRYPEARNYTPKEFANAARSLLDFQQARARVDNRMRTEFGIVNEIGMPSYNVGFEYLWKYYCGMKEMSIALRRNKAETKELCAALDEMFLKAPMEALSAFDGPDPNNAFDLNIGMLATTMLSIKQFEEIWAPGVERMLRCAEAHNKQVFFFAEGSWERFGYFFNQFKKGTCCMVVEDDDPYEIRKKYPNICIYGGLDVVKMGRGTPEECVDMAKRAIDELGSEGGLILAPNKMVSFPNDMKSENLKAVGEFVYNYRF